MSSALILGANGYIGKETARAFARFGYRVYGLVRSEEKGAGLALDEITPVVGDVSIPSTYQEYLEKVDVIFDASFPYTSDPVKHTYTLFDAIKQAASKRAANGGSLTFIFNTGIWLYGDAGYEGISQDSVVSPLAELKWRPQAEQDAINLAPNVRTIVVRPGMVYGRSGGFLGRFFSGIETGSISLPKNLQNALPTIHVDDLAEFYVRAAERSPQVKGVIFTVINYASESLPEIIRAVRRIADREITLDEYEPQNLFDRGLSLTQVIDSRFSRNLVEWQPRKRTLVEGISEYYKTWKAYQ
ncbi:hypothetical protein GGI15_000084 [Coemansia interrupta]|uniref:NAD-dependent epimerase/dehydratase domain-containing protein n=1 Tax=Coemansia interrupta TaxID=1126814 RepID=A0A9W8HQE0_9FUNG|nr:hypothetical protein GGI15_000084 [Coemansia interrupta]